MTTKRIAWALIALGIALRFWQWLAGVSFWLDEIALARNIVELPLGTLLTEPLRLDQVAPRGFLFLAKLSTMAFGEGERALRLPALLVTVAAMPLFWHVARTLFTERTALFALALAALALPLIHYAAEVKQYGFDAAGTLAAFAIALRLDARAPTRREAWYAALAGFGMVWFAQATVLVLAGCGAALVLNAWLRDGRRAWTDDAVRLVVPVWALGAVLAVLAGKQSMTPSTAAFMQEFWLRGFAPSLTDPVAVGVWMKQVWVALFEDPWLLRYRWGVLVSGVALLGTLALWRRNAANARVVLAPIAVALAAAMAHQYPINGRVAVYLVPLLVILFAAGAAWIGELLARRERHPVFAWAALAFALVPGLDALWRTGVPLAVEDSRPVFAYLQAHRQPGDAIWVPLIGASQARHYGSRYGLLRTDYDLGSCDPTQSGSMLGDFDRYRGKTRVWVITTGQLRLQPYLMPVRRYLDTIGVKRDSVLTGSDIFLPLRLDLYDLSDTTRLRAATVVSFGSTPIPPALRTGCRDWSIPISRGVRAPAPAAPSPRPARVVARR